MRMKKTAGQAVFFEPLLFHGPGVYCAGSQYSGLYGIPSMMSS